MNFDDAFDRLMGHEGGYVNDANDPGGETKWGISKRSYPAEDIKALTREQAKAIYLRDFWQAVGAEKMPWAVAFQAFDFAVNSGIPTAIRALQRALGVADDGHFGPVSQKASAAASASDTCMRLLAERLDYMTRLAGWAHFGRGWARRIAANLRFAAEDD